MSLLRFCLNIGLILVLSDLAFGQVYNVYVSTLAGAGPTGGDSTKCTSPFANGAGTVATFCEPRGLAIDKQGNIIVGDTYYFRVRKVTPDGVVSTLAGTGTNSFGNGAAASASFARAIDVHVDPNNNVYVADLENHRIRLINTQTNQVSTVAGTGAYTPFADGAGASATFYNPHGVYFDLSNNTYVADFSNNKVRVITPAQVVSTLAGTGTAGTGANPAPAASAQFNGPTGLTVSGNGVVYVADRVNHRIRKIEGGIVTTIAGSDAGTSGYQDGAAASSLFNAPYGMTIGFNGHLFISDGWNSRIRMLTLTGTATVSTVAGVGPSGNGAGSFADGPGTVAGFNWPDKLAFDSMRNLYVADTFNHRIRKVSFCSTSAIFDSVNKNCSCPSDKYMNSNFECMSCPVGSESNPYRTVCVSCAAGKFRNSSMNACDFCPSGMESSTDKTFCVARCTTGQEPSSDQLSCVNCAPGKYRPSLDYNVCVNCPLYGTCNSTALVSCQAGYKINSAANGCEECPVGTQSAANSLSCVSCVLGSTYRSIISQSSCQACPASNSVCTTTGFICNAGYELNSAANGCQQCADGYSKSASGNAACSVCPLGKDSALNKQSCVDCASGKYRSSNLYNKCVPCPAFGNCSTTAIVNCANGYKISPSGDSCEQCPIGQHSVDGVNCIGCDSGFFKPSQDFDTCIPCPDGASCGGSVVSCQSGYFFTTSQCKRNDTYFALQQTATSTASTMTAFVTVTRTETSTSTTTSTSISVSTSTSTSTSTTSLFYTVSQTGTVTVASGGNQATVSVTVTQTGSSSPQVGASQVQSANSVTIDFIGTTLPISPLIFAAVTFGAGSFIMLILSLVCCRRAPSRRKDEEFDVVTGMTTSGMNTTSQRTVTNTTTLR